MCVSGLMDFDKLENTPPEVADLISDIIKDKVVCDIGCGEGDFMQALEKHAKKVIGIEEVPQRAKKAKEKGFRVINECSFFNELPEADVYYSWTRDSMGICMKAWHEETKGIFIFGFTRRPSLLKFLKKLKTEKRTVNGFDVYILKL